MARADLTGEVLDGRYRILEPVAEGAMGVVYRAERVKLGRIVAVKVLHDVLPTELASRRRFEIEAMAMAKLEHPHCAAVVDVGLHGDRPFVVMDFVSGQNLKEVIAEQAPLPIPRAVELARQILSGLAHAHEHGIVHRDIKPANLVLSQKAGLGDHVKILDFGLARLNHDSSITTGVVVGTPAYMAPEQIRGLAIDGRVDLYATGVVLFELLTGTKPFVSATDDPIEVCTMHLKVPPPRLADRRPDGELAALEGVIARALAKDRDDRFASATEFAAALDAIAARRGAVTPASGGPAAVAEVGTARTIPLAESDLSAGSSAGTAAPAERPSSPAVRPSSPAVRPSSPAVAPPPVPPAPAERPSSPAARPSSSSSSPGATPAPAGAHRRLLLVVGAGAAIIAGAVLITVLRSGGGSATSPDAALTAPGPESGPPDPASEALARADALLADGKKAAALELVLAARKGSPDDARLPFLAGRLYFDKLYWTEGMKLLREAIRLDPRYRSDPELIKTVLRGFNTTPGADPALAAFLREDIGDAARPYLEETAADHPNPRIRARAAAELKRYR